jgi:hypothetical protein
MVALDPGRREPVVGLVAFNPNRATGFELQDEHVDGQGAVVWKWAYLGVTFHPRHAEVCVGAEHHAGQEALTL